MKGIFLTIAALSFVVLAYGQYGNEWIDYNKSYYKVQTAEDGIYRISYTDLVNLGFPITVDPRRIQLFHRGEEVAIHIQGQGDAVFDPTDYIEFYGQRNDGTLDAGLYEPASAQPHPFYNLFSDSSAYFLTYHLTPASGRRMASYLRNNVDNIPPEPSHRAEQMRLITNQYAIGESFSVEDVTQYTYFDEGEGWTGDRFQEGQNRTYQVSGITNLAASPGISLEVFLMGRDDLSHNATILAGPDEGSLRSLGTASWTNYGTTVFTASLTSADIAADGTVRVRIQCNGTGGQNDLISVSYVRIRFNQLLNAANQTKKFNITASTGFQDAFLQMTNIPAGALLYDITDTRAVRRVGYVRNGNNGTAVVTEAATGRNLFLTADFKIPVLSQASIRPIELTGRDFLIVTNKHLRKPGGGVQDPVREYAAYRASAAGGGYDTLTVDVSMLFDQFSYGETSPLALYRFFRKSEAEGDFRYIFLIGKGMDANVNFHRIPQGYIEQEIFGTTYRLRDLVPSAGMPGADMYFVAGLSGEEHVPAIPIGRLPAVNSGQVMAYLNKVRTMEEQPFDDLFRKDVLHLSGGLSALELVVFNRYMNDFAEIAENIYFGGEVTTIRKDNTEVVQLININDEVNAGLNLVTFFGHSAPFVTDIDIGFVSDPSLGYNNPDKYPMFLINGCQAGQFFSNDVVFGEDWILAQNKGAVGFIAHSSFGFSSTLRRYSELFYETAYSDSVNLTRGIGDIQKEVARRYIAQVGDAAVNVAQAQQMVLLGDPAVSLFGAPLPDYETNSNQLFITTPNNEPVTNQLDELFMNVIVRNFGQARNDSLHVEVTRTLRDNTVDTFDSVFARVYYRDTLQVRIPMDANSFGNNQFRVRIDPDNIRDELNENNNSGILNFFIPSNATQNLFPANFGIEDEALVRLVTSSTSTFPKPRSFSFEIDTSAFFNSPLRQSTSVQGNALASWEVNLMPPSTQDSVVYYWRTRYTTPGEGESDQWQTTSFTLIADGPEGWTQREYPQFIQNRYAGLEADPDRRVLKFSETPVDVTVYTGGSASDVTNQDVSLRVGGTEYIISGQYCATNTLNLVAFDRTTAVPYLVLPYQVLDPRTCGRQPQIINSFTNSRIETGSGDLPAYINSVDNGDVVLAFTIGYPGFASWSANIRNQLTSIGLAADEIDSWVMGEPVIIIGRKGAEPGTAMVLRTEGTPPQNQDLTLIETIIGYVTSAMLETTLIGPASSWGEFLQHIETGPGDQVELDLIGVTLGGFETLLLDNITESRNDLSTVDASLYPYVRLRLAVKDEQEFTAPQVEQWLVSYEGVPEGFLLASSVKPPQVSLDEGEILENEFSFVNISERSFSDSLEVSYELFNRSNRTTLTENFRIKAPLPGDTTRFRVETLTAGNPGEIDYQVFVNPFVEPEQYYDNNLVDLGAYLQVKPDNINPVIDVVFDGEYIMDGDIVSPTPLITARLVDNNEFLFKKDTLGVNLLFRENCQGCSFRRIPFSSALLNWFPASEDESYRLEFRPERLDDGMYTLQLEATDASGNQAGEKPYEINFQVINESTITNFYPYPNPFSTSTRFVFTLTGSEVPSGIKIQIMTVTGKVVREITQDELGPVRIGHNLTDYAWDGRDEFGDELANGVYLYRVILQGTEAYEHRATAGDQAFRKGVGKLYILR